MCCRDDILMPTELEIYFEDVFDGQAWRASSTLTVAKRWSIYSDDSQAVEHSLRRSAKRLIIYSDGQPSEGHFSQAVKRQDIYADRQLSGRSSLLPGKRHLNLKYREENASSQTSNRITLYIKKVRLHQEV